MKLVKRLTAAVVALAVAAPCVAFAENFVYYDAENATVEYLYGTDKNEVSVIVNKEGDTSKIANVDQLQRNGLYIGNKFTMPDDADAVPSGKYVIDVRDNDGGLVGDERFWFVNPADAGTVSAIGELPDPMNAEALAGFIETNGEFLGVDTVADADVIADVAEYLVYFDLSTAKKFAKNYAYAKLLNTLKNKDKDAVITEITKFANAKLIGIDSDAFKNTAVNGGYTDAAKNEVTGKLSKALDMLEDGTIDTADFDSEVYEWVALARLNAAPTAAAFKPLFFTEYNDLFKDIEGYDAAKALYDEKTTYQDAIIGDMLAYTFTSKETVVSTFKSEAEENRSKGGGGGGGGGSYPDEDDDESGEGGSVIIPPNPSEIKGRYLDDVGGHWAETMINDLYNKGIVNGSDNKFYPNNNITRAEFCTLIAQAFYKNKTGSTSSFGDVTPDDWYYSYVGLLNAKGIVSGMGDGTFGARSNITRQDMAAIIARCMKDLGKSTEATREMTVFTDAADIASYSVEAIEMLYTANVISGYEDGSFNPTANLTKAEAATVIFKLLNK